MQWLTVRVLLVTTGMLRLETLVRLALMQLIPLILTRILEALRAVLLAFLDTTELLLRSLAMRAVILVMPDTTVLQL